jgi:hypothetical protein
MSPPRPPLTIVFCEDSDTFPLSTITSDGPPGSCIVELDLKSGVLCATAYEADYSGAMPEELYRGQWLHYEIPSLRGSAANRLLREIAPFAERVLASSEFLPENYLRSEATWSINTSAAHEIGKLCKRLWERPEDRIVACDAEWWLVGQYEDQMWGYDEEDDLSVAERLGIDADTTDAELDAMAARITGESGYEVVYHLEEYLRKVRAIEMEAVQRAEAERAAAVANEQLRREAERQLTGAASRPNDPIFGIVPMPTREMTYRPKLKDTVRRKELPLSTCPISLSLIIEGDAERNLRHMLGPALPQKTWEGYIGGDRPVTIWEVTESEFRNIYYRVEPIWEETATRLYFTDRGPLMRADATVRYRIGGTELRAWPITGVEAGAEFESFLMYARALFEDPRWRNVVGPEPSTPRCVEILADLSRLNRLSQGQLLARTQPTGTGTLWAEFPLGQWPAGTDTLRLLCEEDEHDPDPEMRRGSDPASARSYEPPLPF